MSRLQTRQDTKEYKPKVDITDETPQTDEIFQDVPLEWKLLNKLMQEELRDQVNRLASTLFTGIRIEVFRAMQLAFIDNGTVTYEGIEYHMKGAVPGELLAANGGEFYSLLKQAIRIAKKRQIKTRARLLEALAKDYDPSDAEVTKILDFEPIMAEEDSSLAPGVQSFLGSLHGKLNGDYIFRRTGFKFLDRTLGGEYRPNNLFVLLGDSGSGKTAFWLQSAKSMAIGYTHEKTGEQIVTPSLFISLEMTKSDLLLRMVAEDLEINNTDLSAGDFDQILADTGDRFADQDELIRAIENTMDKLQQLPLYVIDNDELTLPQILYQIRRHVHKFGVRVVGIDYLQLVNYAETGIRNIDLGIIAQQLKAMAKREGISIILFSQVNSKEGMDAIRDSGEIRAVASVIMQLLPDVEDDLSVSTPYKAVNAGIWKNRFGRAGHKIPLIFHGPYQRFQENI